MTAVLVQTLKGACRHSGSVGLFATVPHTIVLTAALAYTYSLCLHALSLTAGDTAG